MVSPALHQKPYFHHNLSQSTSSQSGLSGRSFHNNHGLNSNNIATALAVKLPGDKDSHHSASNGAESIHSIQSIDSEEIKELENELTAARRSSVTWQNTLNQLQSIQSMHDGTERVKVNPHQVMDEVNHSTIPENEANEDPNVIGTDTMSQLVDTFKDATNLMQSME